jgi:monooxygenase
VSADHVDVLIVGAGISGICAGFHVQDKCPGKSYAILEARGAIGGTWDLFRYPGIRSDSDMYTLGFRFRPWPDAKTIADGPAIHKYVNETAAMYGIDKNIRFHRRVVGADWSGEDARWTLTVEHTDSGTTSTMTCNFLMLCGGYYDYDNPYSPEFPGSERFRGEIVHPQLWSDDVDYDGKRVVVIGSGATAVTLVPAMAERAAHVTMLQRSPSYVVSLPGRDPIAHFLRKFLPARVVYPVVRWKNVLITMLSYQLSRRRPRMMKAILRRAAERELPPGYPLDPNFRPSYNPWDQRLCVVPDGDLFKAICSERASVVTDRIETFTETGIRLESGRELEADLIVTATGLNMVPMGGLDLSVDGDHVHLPDHLTYKGLMLDDVPNMAFTVGYTNASWTLKCELSCEYVARLLNHMDEHGHHVAVPRRGPDVRPEPLIDFSSGYVQRAIHMFPKQGNRRPWRLYQNYALDRALLTRGDLEDSMEFSPAPARERVAA